MLIGPSIPPQSPYCTVCKYNYHTRTLTGKFTITDSTHNAAYQINATVDICDDPQCLHDGRQSIAVRVDSLYGDDIAIEFSFTYCNDDPF